MPTTLPVFSFHNDWAGMRMGGRKKLDFKTIPKLAKVVDCM